MGNTKIRPIAMKCNQEQFEAVKGKLKGMEINEIDRFESHYLINCFRQEKNVVSNLVLGALKISETTFEIHETWNEEIFLNACGIETEPTYTITKEQLLELENGFTLPKLKQWFPDVFDVKKNDTRTN